MRMVEILRTGQVMQRNAKCIFMHRAASRPFPHLSSSRNKCTLSREHSTEIAQAPTSPAGSHNTEFATNNILQPPSVNTSQPVAIWTPEKINRTHLEANSPADLSLESTSLVGRKSEDAR